MSLLLALAAYPLVQPFWLAVPAPGYGEAPPTIAEATFAEIDGDLVIDGEWTALWQVVPIGDEVEVGLLGYSLHGGFMDRAVDEWHEFFGMPLGDRPLLPIDEVFVQYAPGGTPAFTVDGGGAGVAPPHVSWRFRDGWRLAATPVPGAGPFDVWRGPSGAVYKEWSWGSWQGEIGGGWFSGISMSPSSHGKAFGGVSFFRPVAWGAQTLEITARFLSHLHEGPGEPGALGDVVAEGGLAMAFPWGDQTVRVGFTEDLRVGTSADFALWFQWEPR